MKPNILLAIPSPRDIPEFQKAMDSITDIDKLWFKYCPAHITYPLIRKEFLNHPNKYTHLVICPDDLLITREHLQTLMDDYTNLLVTDEERDTTVISGYCNVDTSQHAKEANICIDYVTPRKLGRRYKWIKLSAIASMKGIIERKRKDRITQENMMQSGQDKITHYDDEHPYEFQRQFLLPVKFSGFPLIMIPRKILEKIDLRNDAPAYPEKMHQSHSEDVMLCHHCLEKGYKIFVDIRVGMKHLKFSDASTIELVHKQLNNSIEPFMKYEYGNVDSMKPSQVKHIPIDTKDLSFLRDSPSKPVISKKNTKEPTAAATRTVTNNTIKNNNTIKKSTHYICES